ncbi:hypothetical protein R3P38DRAFT_3350043 [Favolaschia claudopus]|uniref:Uncharacterized protein n=1 Tax=Favolaschia claudopus TaxID=2862362 RepID=A0AAW0CPW0_9AGAR
MSSPTKSCPSSQQAEPLTWELPPKQGLRTLIFCEYGSFICTYSPLNGTLVGGDSARCTSPIQPNMDVGVLKSASESSSPVALSSTVNHANTLTAKPSISSSNPGTNPSESPLPPNNPPKRTTEGLPHSAPISPTIPSSTNSTGTSTQPTTFSTTQHTIASTSTPAAATHLKPSTLAAIAIGAILTFFIIVSLTFIWLYKRRHSVMRTLGAQWRFHPRSALLPFALPSHTHRQTPSITDKRNIIMSRPLAQRVLQNELDAAREKVVELEGQEIQTRSILTGPMISISESAVISQQRPLSDTVVPRTTQARESTMHLAQSGRRGRAEESEDADADGPPPEYDFESDERFDREGESWVEVVGDASRS